MKGTKRINKLTSNVGEGVACKYLEKLGFKIIQRNFLRKCGEIDIIAEKHDYLYFIEVKSVTRKTFSGNEFIHRDYKPEDNVDKRKILRLRRVIQLYLAEKGITSSEWHFMIISVLLNMKNRRARVSVLYEIL